MLSQAPVRHHVQTPSVWRDSPQRYGRISRCLHWGMALLLAWQFAGMLAKVSLGRDAAWTKWLASAHADMGLLLLVLVVVRLVWAWTQQRQRPQQTAAAWLGHLALYGLMLVVPLLALLRMLGQTRAFSWWGWIPLNAGGGEKVEWMIAPAAALHGLLGWVLLALIAGHVGMVILHRWYFKDEVAQRMIGR